MANSTKLIIEMTRKGQKPKVAHSKREMSKSDQPTKSGNGKVNIKNARANFEAESPKSTSVRTPKPVNQSNLDQAQAMTKAPKPTPASKPVNQPDQSMAELVMGSMPKMRNSKPTPRS